MPIFEEYSVDGEIFEADLSDLDSIRGLFHRMKPSVTFNLAGYGVDPAERDEALAYRINADLVRQVCATLARSADTGWGGQDLVHVGSALEYGIATGNLAEDTPPIPTTLYGRSKLAGTEVLTRGCEAHGLNCLTARLFTVYGPGEHRGRLLPSLLLAARTGERIQLTDGRHKRDFTYVEDVAEGLLRLGLTPTESGEIVNLATGHLTSVRCFAETAGRALNICADKLRFGAIPTRKEEMNHSEVAVGRLRQLISWVPTTAISEGIRKTIDFEMFHPAGRGWDR
jgi:nucleoside-diphosphate-sugar epimerase